MAGTWRCREPEERVSGAGEFLRTTNAVEHFGERLPDERLVGIGRRAYAVQAVCKQVAANEYALLHTAAPLRKAAACPAATYLREIETSDLHADCCEGSISIADEGIARLEVRRPEPLERLLVFRGMEEALPPRHVAP